MPDLPQETTHSICRSSFQRYHLKLRLLQKSQDLEQRRVRLQRHLKESKSRRYINAELIDLFR